MSAKRAAPLEEGYESKRRIHRPPVEERDLLPVKALDGRWRGQKEKILEREPEDGSDNEVRTTAKVPTNYKVAKDENALKPIFVESEEEIAKICIQITQDPVEHVGCIGTLRSMLAGSTHNPAMTALLVRSLQAVFKDILPSWSIRELTEKELKVKVSKEVQQQRNYESALLANYQHFIRFLRQTILSISEEVDPQFRLLCLRSVAELAVCCKEFNFHDKLVSILIKDVALNSYGRFFSLKSKACREVCAAIERILRLDANGKDSLYVTEAIGNQLHSNGYEAGCVHPLLIKTLTALQISQGTLAEVELATTRLEQLAPGARHIPKREKKKLKEQLATVLTNQQQTRELEEKERYRRYREIVKHLFRIYFGILQNSKESIGASKKASGSKDSLLSVALEGLAKFTSLIGAEYFGDLMGSLRSLASLERIAGFGTGIQLLIAAFRILNLRVESSFFDLKTFYVYFYRLLLANNPKEEAEFGPIETAFELMFLRLPVASAPPQRVLSFGILLCSKATSQPNWIAILKRMVDKYPILKDEIFDNDADELPSAIPIQSSDPDCPQIACIDRCKIIPLLEDKDLRRK